MTQSDERHKLRIEHIQAQKSASKPVRALLQLRKIVFREFFVRQKSPRVLSQDVENLVLSVAFNNPGLIELQAQALRRFVSESHHFVVIDNSSDEEQSTRLEELGDGYGFSYVKAPRNPASVGEQVINSLAQAVGSSQAECWSSRDTADVLAGENPPLGGSSNASVVDGSCYSAIRCGSLLGA